MSRFRQITDRIAREVAQTPRRLYELLTLPRTLKTIVAQVADATRQVSEVAAAVEKIEETRKTLGEYTDRVESHLRSMQGELKAEFSAELGFGFHDLQQLLDAKYAELGVLTAQLKQAQDGAIDNLAALGRANAAAEARLAALEPTLMEARSALTRLGASLHAQATKTEGPGSFEEKSRDLLEKFEQAAKSEIEALVNALAAREKEIRSSVEYLEGSLAARIKNVENLQFEMKNLISHLQTSTEARLNSIGNEQSETRNLITHAGTSLNARLDKLENEELPSLGQEIHELTALHFQRVASTRSNRKRWTVSPEENYQRAQPESFVSYLALAKREMPCAFPLWKERLEATSEAFAKTKVGNAAHVGDVYSRLFRSFVEIHAGGRVLDVGCGVFGRPYYLASYPGDLISGLDPLTPVEPPDFEFVQGMSEYLPWPDRSFSTAISATSLDHCLALDRSLAEIRRVLRPGGKLLLWIGSVPGAVKPDLQASAFTPADQFHLFHFDSVWLEPALEQSFETVDRVELRKVDYSHVMYSLVKRKQ
jgi:SAM-dependent methyltransferase